MRVAVFVQEIIHMLSHSRSSCLLALMITDFGSTENIGKPMMIILRLQKRELNIIQSLSPVYFMIFCQEKIVYAKKDKLYTYVCCVCVCCSADHDSDGEDGDEKNGDSTVSVSDKYDKYIQCETCYFVIHHHSILFLHDTILHTFMQLNENYGA